MTSQPTHKPTIHSLAYLKPEEEEEKEKEIHR